jgi:hypothetical protein
MPFENEYNATFGFPLDRPPNMSLPWDDLADNYSQCKRLDTNFTDEYFESGIPAKAAVACSEWVYDHTKYLSSAVFEVIFCSYYFAQQSFWTFYITS